MRDIDVRSVGGKMDKHTRRYLFEKFGHVTEGLGLDDLAHYINQAEKGSEDFAYLHSAVNEIEDETYRKVYKEQLLKKQMGWD